MWRLTWNNLINDLAGIQDLNTDKKKSGDPESEIHISPEDEAAELRKDLGL